MPVDADTKKFLDEVKKGKPRKFAMICKGAKILSLIVYKKGTEEKYKKEAKKEGQGQFYGGVITGKGMDITFQLQRQDYDKPPGKELTLKDFLKTEAGMQFKPTYEIVDLLIDVSDGADGDAVAMAAAGAASTSPDAAIPPPAPRDTSVDPPAAPQPPRVDHAKKQQFTQALTKVVPPVQRTLKSPDVAPEVKQQLQTLVGQLKVQVQGNQFDEAKTTLGQIVPIVKQHAPQPPQAAQPKVDGRVDYAKARLAWDAAHKKAEAEFAKLKSAMLAKIDQDPDFEPYRGAVAKMDQIMAAFSNELPDVLDQALNTADDAQRGSLHQRAVQLVQENLQSLENSRFLKMADSNPVLSVAVFSTLSKTLQALVKVLSA